MGGVGTGEADRRRHLREPSHASGGCAATSPAPHCPASGTGPVPAIPRRRSRHPRRRRDQCYVHGRGGRRSAPTRPGAPTSRSSCSSSAAVPHPHDRAPPSTSPTFVDLVDSWFLQPFHAASSTPCAFSSRLPVQVVRVVDWQLMPQGSHAVCRQLKTQGGRVVIISIIGCKVQTAIS